MEIVFGSEKRVSRVVARVESSETENESLPSVLNIDSHFSAQYDSYLCFERDNSIIAGIIYFCFFKERAVRQRKSSDCLEGRQQRFQ